MAKKGMSLTLKIIITLVVVLVAALVILTIFSGGISNIAKTIQDLIGEVEPTEPHGCVTSGAKCTGPFDVCCTAGEQCTQTDDGIMCQ